MARENLLLVLLKILNKIIKVEVWFKIESLISYMGWIKGLGLVRRRLLPHRKELFKFLSCRDGRMFTS